jgi:preprotein translocase subunit SecY
MGGMLETIKNAWKIPQLRQKILFTVIMLMIFRLGSVIPVPGMSKDALKALVAGDQGGVFGMLNTITGNAFQSATIFAMGIVPYINASIIMQLLTVAIPSLERLQKEGEEGRKVIGQYMRYGTVVLGGIQAIALTISLKNAVVGGLNPFSFITIIFSFTAGTAFLMWLGEQITENGIGNGISLIIFAGIISRGPDGVGSVISYLGNVQSIIGKIALVSVIVVAFVAIIVAVIWVQQAERRIPVQYAKKVVGRKVYGGQSTHIPMKVNLAGVMPIIFAMSLMMFPSTIISFFFASSTNGIVTFFKTAPGSFGYALLDGIFIVGFTFFYTMIYFNPVEVSNNLKKNGGFIPGIRPGKPTIDYISKVLNRITLFGGLFLALISILPTLLTMITSFRGVWFAGTSVLILVGVALETIKQMESQMLMRHYKGFLEK